MQHNSFPVRQMAAGAEPPQVRRLLKYLLPARTGITRLPLTPVCCAAEIKDWAGTWIIFTKTLVCSEGRAASVKDQGSISVSTLPSIRSCYHSAWCCLIVCNRVRNTDVDLQMFLLTGQCPEMGIWWTCYECLTCGKKTVSLSEGSDLFTPRQIWMISHGQALFKLSSSNYFKGMPSSEGLLKSKQKPLMISERFLQLSSHYWHHLKDLGKKSHIWTGQISFKKGLSMIR